MITTARRNVFVKLGDTFLYSKEVTREFFDHLAETGEPITIQQRGESLVTVVRVAKTYDHFVLAYTDLIHYGHPEHIAYTINYIDVMNNDTRVTTREGQTESLMLPIEE